MSLEVIAVVLSSWIAVGFLAALFFGGLFQNPVDAPSEQDTSPLRSSASVVKYLRLSKRKTPHQTPETTSSSVRRHSTKHAAG